MEHVRTDKVVEWKMTNAEAVSLARTDEILKKPMKLPSEAFKSKPVEPPPARKVEIIIPAAVAENRPPTIEELLDWIFSEET